MRSKSSSAWLKEHFDDPYVQKAQQLGYRSRACFKLLEIQEKDALVKPGMKVVDLGAAPGGWSQLLVDWVGPKGKVVASDLLPMDPLAEVEFIQGDFTEDMTLERILAAIDGQKYDLVVSDMAPNLSGMSAVDQPAAMYLVELALDLAGQILRPGGTLLTKVFQGQGSEEYRRSLQASFNRVATRKPKASRARSKEVYYCARGYRG